MASTVALFFFLPVAVILLLGFLVGYFTGPKWKTVTLIIIVVAIIIGISVLIAMRDCPLAVIGILIALGGFCFLFPLGVFIGKGFHKADTRN